MTLPPDVEDNADLPEHQVAMIVFTTIRALDYADAASIAEYTLRGVFREVSTTGRDLVTPRKAAGTDHTVYRVPVRVALVRELSAACNSGYLGVTPTSQAYRREPERN